MRTATATFLALAVSSSASGAQSFRLNDDLASAITTGVTVYHVAADPTEQTVAFLEGDRPRDLYVSPLDGSAAPVVLDTADFLATPVYSPDGAYVLYDRRDTPSGVRDLYGVPAAGGAPVPG